MPAHGFTALVRRVSVNETRVLFGGGIAAIAAPRLDPSSNALRFEFAAPDFLDESSTEYQSMLEGLDDAVVGVGARAAAGLHEPGVRRLHASACVRGTSSAR